MFTEEAHGARTVACAAIADVLEMHEDMYTWLREAKPLLPPPISAYTTFCTWAISQHPSPAHPRNLCNVGLHQRLFQHFASCFHQPDLPAIAVDLGNMMRRQAHWYIPGTIKLPESVYVTLRQTHDAPPTIAQVRNAVPLAIQELVETNARAMKYDPNEIWTAIHHRIHMLRAMVTYLQNTLANHITTDRVHSIGARIAEMPLFTSEQFTTWQTELHCLITLCYHPDAIAGVRPPVQQSYIESPQPSAAVFDGPTPVSYTHLTLPTKA